MRIGPKTSKFTTAPRASAGGKKKAGSAAPANASKHGSASTSAEHSASEEGWSSEEDAGAAAKKAVKARSAGSMPSLAHGRAFAQRLALSPLTPVAKAVDAPYLGAGASSTDLRLRAPRRNSDLPGLDLALMFGDAPMVVPPVSLPWLGAAHPTVASLIVEATELLDGRIVDELGRSYMADVLAAKTLKSTGGMLVCFDGVKPQAYWAKRIASPMGEPLPADVANEAELSRKAGSAAAPHRILHTSDAYFMLMPHLMGDHLSLFYAMHSFAGAYVEPAASPDGATASATGGDVLVALKRHYSAKMLEAVAQLHEKNIYHRDIKLLNFAYYQGDVSLIDFDSAHEGPTKKLIRGTPEFSSPESLYTAEAVDAGKVDTFAAAMSVYALYTGRTFYGEATSKEMAGESAYNKALAAYRKAKKAGNDATPSLRAEADTALSAWRTAREEVAVVLADYAKAWPLMEKAARQLYDNRQALAGVAQKDLPEAVAKIVDLSTLHTELSAIDKTWATAFGQFLSMVPRGALAIVNGMAPDVTLRSSARACADMFAATTEAVNNDPALGPMLNKMSSLQVAQSHAQARALVSTVHARLKSPGSHFDELQLENQPSVNSVEEAQDYIRNLAAEKAPNIPVLTDTAGNIKRLRELFVKL